MTVESATYVGDLNTALPASGDVKSEGDDHFRLVKNVLKATFPGLAGAFARTQSKGTNYTVVANDNTTLIVATAAITLNLTAAATLGNKHTFAVYAQGGAVTIDPNSAELVNGLATLVVPAGNFAIVWCTGSAFAAAVLAGTIPMVQTSSLNLQGANTPATVDSMDFTADAVTFRDASGTLFYGSALAVSIDLSVAGANGLNTGTATNDTWYHYYAIRKPDGTKAGLASTTFSHISGPGSLPSGYTQWCYLAAVRYKTAELDNVSIRGNFVYREGNYSAVSTILTSGTATSYTAVSAAAKCPPNTQLVYLHVILSGAGTPGEPVVALFRPTGSGTHEDQIGTYVQVVTQTNQVRAWHWIRPGTSQQVDYRISNAPSGAHGLNLYVLGYTLPNGAS